MKHDVNVEVIKTTSALPKDLNPNGCSKGEFPTIYTINKHISGSTHLISECMLLTLANVPYAHMSG